MQQDRLEPLQRRILGALAGMEPRWRLTGGAALAGFHLGHRTTRDLDLFWHGKTELDRLPELVRDRLRTTGFTVDTLETARAFQRLRVSDGRDVCLVDLVAKPVQALESPKCFEVEGARIEVDSAHEILVNKLCTLLHRSEPRDLVDVEALLANGGDLERALTDAPIKDGGFSPLTLAWLLRDLRVEAAAFALGFDADKTRALLAFRDRLAAEVARLAEPRHPADRD